MKIVKTPMINDLNSVDHFIICACSELTRSTKALRMPTGVGKQLIGLHPSVATHIGSFIAGNDYDCGVYNFRCEGKVGLFQNRITSNGTINLGLVSRAAILLKEHAEANPDKVYALECPNGDDPLFLVQGIIDTLPDNVHVYLQ